MECLSNDKERRYIQEIFRIYTGNISGIFRDKYVKLQLKVLIIKLGMTECLSIEKSFLLCINLSGIF